MINRVWIIRSNVGAEPRLYIDVLTSGEYAHRPSHHGMSGHVRSDLHRVPIPDDTTPTDPGRSDYAVICPALRLRATIVCQPDVPAVGTNMSLDVELAKSQPPSVAHS